MEKKIEETFTYDLAIPVSRRLDEKDKKDKEDKEDYDEGNTIWVFQI